jgi:hypothetical protein
MAAGGRGIEVEINEAELARIVGSPDGPVARRLARLGELITQEAKRRAPVSPDGSHGRKSGYLRSQIGWDLGRDRRGWYVDIRSPARTPEGAPYGLFVEVGTRAHIIRARRKKVLANRKRGQVFGPVVHHPGTAPQPYLRPALDYVISRVRNAR